MYIHGVFQCTLQKVVPRVYNSLYKRKYVCLYKMMHSRVAESLYNGGSIGLTLHGFKRED